jgi:predicted nucleic acid-binding Zn ribbon protein
MSGSIKCPQCGKMMQSDAKVCGFCSYNLEKSQPAAPQKNGLKGCLAVMALIILAVLILVGISSIVSEGPSQPVSMQ